MTWVDTNVLVVTEYPGEDDAGLRRETFGNAVT
jgi:hypothetical protein